MSLLRRYLIFVSLLVSVLVFAQEPTISTPQPLGKTQRGQIRARDAWFQRGRTLSAQSAAALRFHAYQQKLQMRQTQLGARAQINLTPADVIPQIWQSLGPSPLASDASGFGQQDYGWVSGRATAIVID